MASVQVGDHAPDFTLTSQSGQQVSLAGFRGSKAVVLFFYPKDGTAVCTKEACSSLNGLFAQRRNLVRASFYRMLLDVLRFNRQSLELLRGEDYDWELGEYLDRNRYSGEFIEHYLIPMGAAIWSAPPERFRPFPARFIVNFLNNHGLLTVRGHPQWKTVQGGARRYVEALTRPFANRIRLNCPVVAVRRHPDRVAVTWQHGGPEDFDAVVLAAHSEQSLAMLVDANQAEREIMGAFAYQRNDTVLHVDSSLLPRCPRAWASWNYRIPREEGQPVVLTYNLNRLQGHVSPDPICITLNGTRWLDEKKIVRRIEYHHPVYSREALAAQKQHEGIRGRIVGCHPLVRLPRACRFGSRNPIGCPCTAPAADAGVATRSR
jgi:uncharacterized protein